MLFIGTPSVTLALPCRDRVTEFEQLPTALHCVVVLQLGFDGKGEAWKRYKHTHTHTNTHTHTLWYFGEEGSEKFPVSINCAHWNEFRESSDQRWS